MTEYLAVLKDREALVDKTTKLSSQNAELKKLISTYTKSNDNKHYAIPPHATVPIMKALEVLGIQ